MSNIHEIDSLFTNLKQKVIDLESDMMEERKAKDATIDALRAEVELLTGRLKYFEGETKRLVQVDRNWCRESTDADKELAEAKEHILTLRELKEGYAKENIALREKVGRVREKVTEVRGICKDLYDVSPYLDDVFDDLEEILK